MRKPIVWSLGFVFIVLLISCSSGASEEAKLRCTRCPATCTSAHTYQVSCHNACRSLNPRLTETRCVDNQCVCREPSTTTSTAPSTTTTKKQNYQLFSAFVFLTIFHGGLWT